MKRSLLILLGSLLFAFAIALASDQGPWFDPVNCAFCKQFANQPGLFDHMKHDYHQLHNGLLAITHVDPEYAQAYAKAQEGVGGVIKDMRAGKQVTTCRHCSTQGQLFIDGVAPDVIKRGDDYIVVYTSSDTSMVRRIQEFGKNSVDAYAAMEAEKKATKK